MGMFARAPRRELEVPQWQFPGEARDLQMHILVTPPSRRDRRSQRNSKKLEWLIAWCWEVKQKAAEIGLLTSSPLMLPGNHVPEEGSLPADMPVLESWE